MQKKNANYFEKKCIWLVIQLCNPFLFREHF